MAGPKGYTRWRAYCADCGYATMCIFDVKGDFPPPDMPENMPENSFLPSCPMKRSAVGKHRLVWKKVKEW